MTENDAQSSDSQNNDAQNNGDVTAHDVAARNGEVADRMRLWAIVLLIVGLVASFGLTAVFADFGVDAQSVWVFVRFISKVCLYFGLPLSASLFVGSIIVRRLR